MSSFKLPPICTNHEGAIFCQRRQAWDVSQPCDKQIEGFHTQIQGGN